VLFNSTVFLLFALVFFATWRLLRGRKKARLAFLIVASFFFYGWWNWRYVFLLLYTGLIDFSAGLLMGRYPARKKLWLVLSLCGNVGALATFKYLGFVTGSVNTGLALVGWHFRLPVYSLVLPVGISFYTFESLSYTVDIYRGETRPTRDPLQFFSFLSLFPHLVAGPIIRPRDLMPQLAAEANPTPQQWWDGLKLIAQGFFKKMVIADQLAWLVNTAFADTVPVQSAPYWWLVTTAFAFQIYCDFSGYTDIARGLAKWMGYEFPVNFDHPYISTSLREFWTRWHISLSSWFRDYVYIPLGGSRKGAWAGHRNMWLTMLLSGLWHGAAWHFVIWGGLHAFYVSLERITEWPKRLSRLPGGRGLSCALVTLLVWVGWVFFRAQSATRAVGLLSIMFSPSAWNLSALAPMLPALPFLLIGIVWELWFLLGLDRAQWAQRAGLRLEPAVIAALLVASIYLRGSGEAFIYFQF
jgi:D-alanyl-lipoteichoic acid acyltransferase DltB (MBOAT superfamily)